MSPLPVSSPTSARRAPAAPTPVVDDPVHRARPNALHRRRARWAAGSLALALVVLASACGASKTTTTTGGGSTATTGGSTSASAAAYRSCLAKHGVTLPTGGFRGGGGGSGSASGATGSASTPPSAPVAPTGVGSGSGGGFRNNPKFAAAQKACASLRPKGSFGGGAAGSSAFQAFASCMTTHGITMGRRPGSSTSGSTATSSAPPTSVDTSSPAYQAAYAVCKALLPAGSTGRFGGGTSSPSTTAAA